MQRAEKDPALQKPGIPSTVLHHIMRKSDAANERNQDILENQHDKTVLGNAVRNHEQVKIHKQERNRRDDGRDVIVYFEQSDNVVKQQDAMREKDDQSVEQQILGIGNEKHIRDQRQRHHNKKQSASLSGRIEIQNHEHGRHQRLENVYQRFIRIQFAHDFGYRHRKIKRGDDRNADIFMPENHERLINRLAREREQASPRLFRPSIRIYKE